jgi:hypothetical protein
MDKKNLMYIVGGVAVVGIAYYLYKKKQASKIAPVTASATAPVTSEGKSEDDSLVSTETMPLVKPLNSSSTMPVSASTTAPTTTPPLAPPTAPLTTPSGTIKLSKFEVETRMLKLCGVRPALKGSVRRNNYNACLTREKDKLRSQGYISFNNSYSNMTSDFDVSFR